jgi:hypothetical protein
MRWVRHLRIGSAAAIVALACLGLAASPAGADAAAAPGAVPVGYRADSTDTIVPGVVHVVLESSNPARVVQVVRIASDAAVSLRAVQSNDAIAGAGTRLERTSAMCIRVDCLVAVNGDFAAEGTSEPLGAIADGGVLERSPNPTHHQLVVGPDSSLWAGQLGWSAKLLASDLSGLDFTGLNVDRGPGDLVLYTPAFGPATATNQFGAELTAHVVDPAGPVRIGQTTIVELTGLGDGVGNAPIPADGIVISGHGASADALRGLWARVTAGAVSRRALLRVETSVPTAETIGGTPLLVHNGVRWVAAGGGQFVEGHHPRTIVGWTASGERLLVTVDGRQPGYSDGLSLPAAADLMISLGATEAINLDGGGSTTMVLRGNVVNRPSDTVVRRGGQTTVVVAPSARDNVIGHAERPVESALAVVARATAGGASPGAVRGPVALGPGELALPHTPVVPTSRPRDPGSVPNADVPVMVGVVRPSVGFGLVTVALALQLAVAASTAAVVARRR